ncbi:hypothetical protein [Hyphococcus sp.]|jgi:hypothetical protein|uniref:hypothetical protein n=1 Tax=Hyphococcus sp. TaxID=2038636 RepID=UPI003D141ADB
MPGELSEKKIAGAPSHEMEKYGIKCVRVDYFHIGGYRYTDIKDAVAQAKRMKKKP